MGSVIWSIFTARRYAKRGICRRRESPGFVLTSASRGPSAIAELLVIIEANHVASRRVAWFDLITSTTLKRKYRTCPAYFLAKYFAQAQQVFALYVSSLMSRCAGGFSAASKRSSTQLEYTTVVLCGRAVPRRLRTEFRGVYQSVGGRRPRRRAPVSIMPVRYAPPPALPLAVAAAAGRRHQQHQCAPTSTSDQDAPSSSSSSSSHYNVSFATDQQPDSGQVTRAPTLPANTGNFTFCQFVAVSCNCGVLLRGYDQTPSCRFVECGFVVILVGRTTNRTNGVRALESSFFPFLRPAPQGLEVAYSCRRRRPSICL